MQVIAASPHADVRTYCQNAISGTSGHRSGMPMVAFDRPTDTISVRETVVETLATRLKIKLGFEQKSGLTSSAVLN